MELNSEQLAATAIGVNLAVNAGAGTGKTTVLTSRYLRLLTEGGLTPGQIVAITFTKKAAREMRERIDGSLAALARQDPRWKETRDQLVAAPISTIHSFYARVLRAFPLEGQVKPAFRVLAELEAGLLLKKAAGLALEQAAQEKCPHLALLAEILGAQALETGGLARQVGRLYTVLRNRGIPVEGAGLARSYEELPSWSQCRQALADLAAKEARLDTVLAGKDKPEMARDRRALLKGAGDGAAAQDSNDLIELYPDLLALTSLKGGRIGGHKEFIQEGVLAVQNALSRALAPALGEGILSLLQRLDRIYARLKDRAGGLDFSDLQFAMERLLRTPRVKAALKEKYATYMLDEFQDTDGLQHRIIKALVEEEGNIPAGRLFVVGDEKQSIYRFRGARVQEFQRLREMLVRADPQAERRITCNFRAQKPLLDLVNTLFSRLLPQVGGMEYLPLTPQRPGKRPGAEFLACSGEKGSAAEEGAALAARIGEMVESGATEQALKYGDIAILLRSRTHLKEYEHHLRLQGIPYTVVGGIGFYQQPEVLDMLNLLRVVRHGWDELSLVALLRSPLFALDDDSLYALVRSRGQSGGGLLDQDQALSGEQRQRLLRASEVIGRLRAARGRLELPRLLELAFQLTQYREAVLTGYGGLQRLANLEKLAELAEEFTDFSLEDDFLDWVEEASAWDEEEAPVDSEESDSVRIMTIHASKGLQFPVVFLPIVNAKLRPSYGSVLADTDGGLAFNFPWRCPVWEKAKEQERQEELAEYIRLLYVAMTRARDRLIFLGQDEEKEEQSFNSWIRALAQEAPKLIQYREEAKAGEGSPRFPLPLPQPGPPAALPRGTLVGLAPSSSKVGAAWYFSMSQFLLWRRDREQFRRRYLSPAEGMPVPVENSEEVVGGAAFGSLLHRLMETVPDDRDLPSLFQELLPRYFPAASPALAQKVQESARALLEAYRLDPGPPGQYTESCREQEFYYRLQDALFHGVIDQLLFARDHLALVDYKTNLIPAQGPLSLADTYAPQLRFYAMAAEAIYRRPVRAYLQLLRLPPGKQVIEVELSRQKEEELKSELEEFIEYCRRPG